MPVFTYDDIDPLFNSLSETDRETLISIGYGQAGSFITSLHAAAEEFVKGLGKKQVKGIPQTKTELTEEEYQIALSFAHPTILRSIYVMGFTQGYCMRHRLQALDAGIYSLLGPSDEVEAGESSDDVIGSSAEGTEAGDLKHVGSTAGSTDE